MQQESASALIVDVPAAEPVIGSWRARHDPVAKQGIPAHVTVLYPFVAPAELADHHLEQLTDVLSTFEPFEASYEKVDSFPSVIWLAPDPAERFRAITDALCARFTTCIPYGGRHGAPIPHLTVAHAEPGPECEALKLEIENALVDRLPIDSVASTVSLYVSNPVTEWERLASIPLGG